MDSLKNKTNLVLSFSFVKEPRKIFADKIKYIYSLNEIVVRCTKIINEKYGIMEKYTKPIY